MKSKNLIRLGLLMAIAIGIFTSCKKDSAGNSSQATAMDYSNIVAERIFNDIGNFTTNVMASNNSNFKSVTDLNPISSCLHLSFNFNSRPASFILDFGSENCFCEDGQNRRGKIILTFDVAYGDSLATMNTSFDNFFVNDNQITGTRTIKYMGRNQNGYPNWNVTVNGGIILAGNKGTISYQAERNTQMIEGSNTPDYKDNVFSTTGSASGTALDGQAYTLLITTPLVSKSLCPNFVSGVAEITPAGQPKRILNYGNGDCDNKASVTVNNISFDITLP